MSVLGKKWLIKNNSQSKPVIEKILENRGFDLSFAKTDEAADFHDPFLFEDMEKAVNRINKAINDHEKIVVFGDYDVDGISGTAILIHILRELNAKNGTANISYRLPNRVQDGYGLSDKFIDEFTAGGIKLLITVDCGISCARQITKAKAVGIDTIITDHHTIPENSPDDAFAVLHPKYGNSNYPFKELTGAGMALKLAHALIKTNFEQKYHEKYLHYFLDLASLGTIADLGSLVGENRLIVKKGLKNLENTRWAGLKHLKEVSNIKEGQILDTVSIGFQIAPRINAAGRIGDPHLALKLLLSEVEEVDSRALAGELERLNKERQNMTESALDEAEEMLSCGSVGESAGDATDESTGTPAGNLPHILIAHNPNWHVGILGLVAGKLAEKYGRPAIIMQDLGETLVASARSPQYFNIVEAITKFKEYLINFGGHAQAAGFNLAKGCLADFVSKISAYASEKLADTELRPVLNIDCELDSIDINFDLLDEIEKLSPFGVANQKPLFIMRSVKTYFVEQVGSDSNHLKFSIRLSDGREFRVIAFRMGKFAGFLKENNQINLVFSLERNHWRDKDYIQIEAIDFAGCG